MLSEIITFKSRLYYTSLKLTNVRKTYLSCRDIGELEITYVKLLSQCLAGNQCMRAVITKRVVKLKKRTLYRGNFTKIRNCGFPFPQCLRIKIFYKTMKIINCLPTSSKILIFFLINSHSLCSWYLKSDCP